MLCVDLDFVLMAADKVPPELPPQLPSGFGGFALGMVGLCVFMKFRMVPPIVNLSI